MAATMPEDIYQYDPQLEVKLTALAKFNNWDKREAAVDPSDVEAWKKEVAAYLAKYQPKIPKIMHQIWIGPREPPCVWLDSWRVDYQNDNPGWEYRLWTDAECEKMKMFNRDFYDQEKMYQCKADILRLEILYEHGGVYIDADMVSLKKSIDKAVEMGNETGFFITYEPDTKDKAYSVIGNSIIAATPRHPLVKMLMLYIRAVYPHKRPYHGVEWVTGPLAYTKCLAHTNVPMTVPPSVWFYPKFHYIPNPSAINLSAFPESYAFQFGYTCSGLEGWVKNNNKCMRPLRCQYHSRQPCAFPLGKLIAFPDIDVTPANLKAHDAKTIPPVVHQVVCQANGQARPERWMKTWYEDFVKANAAFSYRSWTLEDMKGESYYCSNLYTLDRARPMSDLGVRLLGLELIYRHGGYFVPQNVVWSGLPDALLPNAAGFLERGAVVGCTPGHPKCLKLIHDLYEGARRYAPPTEDPSDMYGPGRVVVGGYSESAAAYLQYPDWTRFLGAEEMFDLSSGSDSDAAMISWAYDSQVVARKLARGFSDIDAIRTSQRRALCLWEPSTLFAYSELRDQLPGFAADLDSQYPGWQAALVCVEFETDEDALRLYRVSTPFRPPKAKYVGVLLNAGCTSQLPSPAAGPDAVIDALLARSQSGLELYCACLKFSQSKELSDIFRCVPYVKEAFQTLASHEAPFERDREEVHGTTWKGMKDHRVSFEVQASGEGFVQYRAWNDDGGINCECRIDTRSRLAEWMKVFFAHQIVYEGQQKKF